jgi:hypothetical protein
MEPLGRSPARAIQAAVRGLPEAGAYRQGWLVFTCVGPCFVYNAGFRSHTADLTGIRPIGLRRGVLADTLEVQTGERPFTFFLLKDGPPADLAAAELTAYTV